VLCTAQLGSAFRRGRLSFLGLGASPIHRGACSVSAEYAQKAPPRAVPRSGGQPGRLRSNPSATRSATPSTRGSGVAECPTTRDGSGWPT
jgi:hypothetical protein